MESNFQSLDDLMYNGNAGDSHAVVGRKSTWVYEKRSDGSVSVVRCVPHDGLNVYYVIGSLVPRRVVASGYFIERNAREARRHYESIYGWKPSACRKVKDTDELEWCLTNPNVMPD